MSTTVAPARRSRASTRSSTPVASADGHRAVVDVAGDEHDVDRLGGHDLGQPAQHRLLLGEQVGAVQRPADVPVGGVQQAHGAER